MRPPGSMRVVVAPDSFKGTISATRAAAAAAAGWRSIRPQDDIVEVPMADGGEGTLDVIAAAAAAAVRLQVRVPGPDDREVEAPVLLLADGTAVVELASTSGITLLRELRPLTAHTRGFGAAIRAAIRAGATRLLLTIGGSASTDGGAGMLRELGARLLDDHGREVGDGGGGLLALAAVDLSGLEPLPPGGALVLSDVGNPLLGPRGAAAVYGPQKGATPADVPVLEAALGRLAAHVPVDPGTPGAGAAGGTGFGLLAWGAELVPGALAVARHVRLPEALSGADLVLTGEGRFDGQSLEGKVPDAVRALADGAGVRAALIAGAIEAPTTGYASAVSLTDLVGQDRALAEPVAALTAAGAALALRT